ncbi:MAG: GNAT family N-acetyltransferase [Maricaulaceae bacterium]|jgi:RimJ/RimL family protein N-acetyltransferase
MSVAVIYRWRVKPGMEDQFADAWSEGTRAVAAQCDSYGARLHRGEGGVWVSYARWPDEASRKACFKENDFRDRGFVRMREAAAETLPEIVMELVDDQLKEPPSGRAASAQAAPPPVVAAYGVRLRPLDLERDLEMLHATFGDPEEMRFMPSPASGSLEETRARAAAWSLDDASPQWAITEDGEAALGRVTLIARREGVMEIGVQLAPAAQGRGLAARAVAAATAFGLGERSLVRVYADIDPDNVRSVRLFERAGYAFEGRLKANWVTHAGVTDSVIYAATTNWRAPTFDGA